MKKFLLLLLLPACLCAQTIRPTFISQLRLTQLTTAQEGTMTLVEGDIWENITIGCIRYRLAASTVCIAQTGSVAGTAVITNPTADQRIAGNFNLFAAKIHNLRYVDPSGEFTTIQAALDAATSGTVYVPNATYVTNGIIFNNNDTNLVCESPLAIIQRTDNLDSGHLLTVDGRSNIKIINCTIDGNTANNTGTLFNIFVTGSSNVLIENVESINSPNAGIDFRLNADSATTDSRSRITNSRIINNDGTGIQLTNVRRVDVDHNLVESNGTTGIALEGLASNVNDDVAISDNQIYGNGGSGIDVPFNTGVSDPFSSQVKVADNIVRGNVTGGSGNGISMQASESSVTDNLVEDNGTAIVNQGILCNGIGLAIKGNIVQGNSGVGIDCGLSIRAAVSGNIVINNDGQGIEFQGTVESSISGNIVVGNSQTTGIGGGERTGIIIHNSGGGAVANPDDVIVSGNIVKSGPNQEFGIQLKEDVGRVIITGNNVFGAGSVRDIDIQTTETVVMGGNITSDLTDVANPLEGTLSNVPRWIFKLFSHTDMVAAATADDFALWTLPANTMIHDVVGTVIIPWAGTGPVTAAVCSVGNQAGADNNLALDDDFFAAGTKYELHDATANGGKGTLLFDATDKFAPFMLVGGDVIEIQCDLTGGNHSTTSAGQARIHMLVSQPLGNTTIEAN